MERAGFDHTVSAPMSVSVSLAQTAGDIELPHDGPRRGLFASVTAMAKKKATSEDLAGDLLKTLGSMERFVQDDKKQDQIHSLRSRIELSRQKRRVLSRAIHDAVGPVPELTLPVPSANTPIPSTRMSWLSRVLRFFNPFDDYDKKGVTP